MSFGRGKLSAKVVGVGIAAAESVTVVVGSSEEKEVRVRRGLIVVRSATIVRW